VAGNGDNDGHICLHDNTLNIFPWNLHRSWHRDRIYWVHIMRLLRYVL